MKHRLSWRAVAVYAGVHVLAIGGVWALGWSRRGVALAVLLYAVRMFALMVGVHRGLAHRAFQTNRLTRFVLAAVATSAAQLGPLWWASLHRLHHRRAGRDGDPHAHTDGIWWAHAGWFLVDAYDDPRLDLVPDLADARELRWLDRHFAVPPLVLIALLAVCGGPWAVVWGFAVSTVALWHATSTLTSLSHWFGTRRFATRDGSRNNPLIALITFGEGWHNNHHRHSSSARLGFAWWEIDLGYLGLRVLAALGLVWDLRGMPGRDG
jgi:stearoyl-CoA desaturase (delta-9 desaturase)